MPPAKRKSKSKTAKSKKKTGIFGSKRRKKKSFKRRLLRLVIILSLWIGLLIASMLGYYAMTLPSVDKLDVESSVPSIELLAINGIPVGQYGRRQHDQVTYDDLPQHLIDAVISTEDRRFFNHMGVDVFGLARAMWANWRAGRIVQGGSTITQQLAKNVFLGPQRTMKRKIQEMMLAFYLEHRFTKEEILTIYLNRIYFGAGNYGIGSAAAFYFNKPVSELNLYESAMLAGLVKAPSRYSPLNNTELAGKRTDQVLINMVNNNTLSPAKAATGEYDLSLLYKPTPKKTHYPYYSDWIKEQLPEYIGTTEDDISVITTLDPDVQQIAARTLMRYVKDTQKRHNVTQGAIVVMSPDGAVRAMVGGVNYKQSQFNRVLQAFRQPGSAFKLFVYLAALEQGFYPDDMFVDEPITIDQWTPRNWNNRYVGQVPMDNAFAYSINTIAALVAKQVTMKRVNQMARRLGLDGELDPNLTGALGTSAVNLLQMTTAYAHIANGGKQTSAYGIVRVMDEGQKVLFEHDKGNLADVLPMDVTSHMHDMLVKVVQEGTAKQAFLDKERVAAGKTGTSQQSRDAWFIGYTKDYVIGVWLGNDNNAPMINVGGGGLPAVIWHDIADKIQVPSRNTTYGTYQESSQHKSFWDKIFGTD